MNIIETIEREQERKDRSYFRSGDLIEVKTWIFEGKKKRIQSFVGLVISIRRRGFRSSFTVRKISNGEGVERSFQIHSPAIEKIILKRSGKVRKSKLYYLRNRLGRN